ncbi:unnamed protein product [Bursaphelenchus okinawaensis]|uniref:Uncharacterized protein n=1 Tax=Bursaphelenchus okinawaensis TaxID=465554 RepID=A0A811JQL8_9BILA|nr:unnamed protein product [Bursaphelenchus okinawaensis]CAG9078115.1 unnamed protein product [Bursaphelenchus okinawaensis]
MEVSPAPTPPTDVTTMPLAFCKIQKPCSNSYSFSYCSSYYLSQSMPNPLHSSDSRIPVCLVRSYRLGVAVSAVLTLTLMAASQIRIVVQDDTIMRPAFCKIPEIFSILLQI